ncbi:MAG: dipicolinate synthase subunit B [Lachnospirales bacterium]
MSLKGLNMGFCMCASFCTIANVIEEIKNLKNMGINIYPIFSYNLGSTDTRFGKAEIFKEKIEEITGNKIINSIKEAEPIGPENKLDIVVVAPCTGNTLAKLNLGITDSPVTMACKAHLRNNKPVVIAISTNDALGVTLKNIGGLIIRKNIYFVPFRQDNYIKKPLSMISDFSKISESAEMALEGKQIQPILL